MKFMKSMLLAVAIGAATAGAQISVIVNKAVDTRSLTTAKVASIYAMDMRSWPNGDRIVVFDSKNDGVKREFFGVLGKSEVEFKKIWMRMQLSGNGKAPESLPSDADVVARVAATPGAIGFVSSGAVSAAVKTVLEIK